MHTRIACRISVIKRIDSRLWLPIESAAQELNHLYKQTIIQQYSPTSLRKSPKTAPHKKKKKQTKIALIYIFFGVQFSQHFLNFKFLYETQFSRCPVINIQKLNYSKFASLTIYAIDSFGSFWLRVSLESQFGFGFWASGLLKSKVFFFCVQIDFCILCICCCGCFCSCCCFYLSCQLNLWNICWYFSFIFGGDTATASQAFLRSWQ